MTDSVFLHDAVPGGNGPCDACGLDIVGGQEVYTRVGELRPWLPEDHDEQSWPIVQWHKACDQGSLSADAAEDQRRP